MHAITYTNTKSDGLRFVGGRLHEMYPKGYAYETATHFVHFFGSDRYLWGVWAGSTVTKEKAVSLQDWVIGTFGASDIATCELEVGQSIAGAWRPGIHRYDDIRQGLSTTDQERHAALQATRLLLDRLDDLMLYIEPSAASLATYSHKTRELLILASTEVENGWKQYLRVAQQAPINGRDHTTRDYVKLLPALHLAEFELQFKHYSLAPFRPFAMWDAVRPAQSLAWYDAYNLTKHDRQTHFDKATLQNAIDAVCAHLVMFSTQFSPYPLYNEGGATSALFKQLFEIALHDCATESFYVPLVELPQDQRKDLIHFDSEMLNYVLPRSVLPFTL